MSATTEEVTPAKERELCPPPRKYSGRLGPMPMNRLAALSPNRTKRTLARAALLIPRIRHYETKYGQLKDHELPAEAAKLRGEARMGKMGRDLVARSFGLCSVAVWRVLGMRPFDVQLAAGIAMHHGSIVELSTGEGKTLTATFPVFLNALAGKGAHVATVNDYLAARDANEMVGPVYKKLGLSIGCLQMKMEDAQRVEAYKADVTYGTASEFGFDFLRDMLKVRGGQMSKDPFWTAWLEGKDAKLDPRVQRGHHFALVDEADSIFIDEARTPLIISSPTRMASPDESIIYHWADGVAQNMERKLHYLMDLKKDKIELTEAGRHLARYSSPPAGPHSKAMDKLFEAVERALHAHFRFVKDHHYMILPDKEKGTDKIVIVDENTGRPMPDRHWREGLHQAVEAKEKVAIHLASDHAAQITFQNYFRLYEKLCGMSGTVIQNALELRKIYKVPTVKVPTNKPIVRTQLPDAVFPTEEAKFDAIVADVKKLVEAGRPVLIGTRSVEKSESLSEKLRQAGVNHRVLNAKQDRNEAETVADAGQPGRVTVATNMAGRGTDIKLGPGVREAGGLHVIGTERHEAIRIDRQLLGRAGRQGDPGSGQFYVSLEDKLLEGLGVEKQRTLEATGMKGGRRDWNNYRELFILAQRRVERKHLRQRLDLMHYDKQRKDMLMDLGADPFVD